MRITTRARDPYNNEVAIWQRRPIRTYDFHASPLTSEQRHKEAALRYHVEITGRIPVLESNRVGLDYQRETWVHEAP